MVFPLAVFALVILATVLTRAFSTVREEKKAGDIVAGPTSSFLRYVWLELKQILKFSRY